MRVFEIKYLGPTDNRGGRMRVTELMHGDKMSGKSYGYPHHVRPWEIEWWALAVHLGLETYDDLSIRTKSVKVQTGKNEHIIVIDMV
jgi:hypothetical protein